MAGTNEQVYQRLKAAQKRLGATLGKAAKANIYQPPAEGEWSVAEILGHICEAEPFWAGKIQTMCRENNPNIGRSEEETKRRVQFVADHAHDPWQEISARLNQAHKDVLKEVQALPAGYLSRRGRHPRWGDITIQGALEHLTDHLDEHAKQIEETVAKVAKA